MISLTTRRTLRLAVLAVLGCAGLSQAAPTAEQTELADRLLQVAQRLATAQDGAPVAAALGDAADQLYEGDTRLLRESIDLRLSLGQRDKAIAALSAFRKADPADQVAQIQSIDLISDGMQTADQKADYLQRVAASSAVPAEVRSHASLLLASVQSQRGRDEDANKALDDALNLNPLNARALQLKLDQVNRQGDATQRVRALVALLMAEPMQYGGYAQLAETLTRVGANPQAADLYGRLFHVLDSTDYLPTQEDSSNYAALLLALKKPKEAADVVNAALKADPRPARLQYLKILSAWESNDAAAAQSAIDGARTQLIRNLMALQSTFDPSIGKVGDATPVALPNVQNAMKLIEAKGDARLAESYLEALGDLAWLDVYFAGKTPPKEISDGIDTLAGQSSIMSNRIAGFSALAGGHNDDAKVKLSAVAARDPLSQLGLLILQLKTGSDKAGIAQAGADVLQKLPTDAWSAMVRWSLKDAGPIAFRTSDADVVIAEAARLPRDWINFTRDGRSHYFVTIDVVKASVQVGEPMLVTLSVQNSSDQPLLIGPGGAIDPRIPLDANVRGAIEQVFPAVAVAKLTGRIVLQPRESTRTTVRLDNGDLDSFSSQNPTVGLSIFASAITNATVRGKALVPGPGGFRTQARNVIDRPPYAFSRDAIRQQLTTQLHSADAVERLHAVATIGASAAFLSRGNPDEQRLAPQAIADLQTAAAHDDSATVRAFAAQQLAWLQDDAGRLKAIQAMLGSADLESKLIGCAMSINRSPQERQQLLAPLATDGNEIIQRLARAIPKLPDAPSPAATQP
ncbi:MAG: tetratricopeptide repeat protein [Tepidisphaeraceae bacterium]